MAEEYLKVENLYKNYGNIKAVNNVSFSAKKGEIIALLGPNGAGKSTLMNMISGYLSPSSGEIFVCDKNIKNNPLWGKENIGFLPEGSPLYADLTVKDFLKYMAELRNVPYKNVENAIKTAKIENVAMQKVETLSKGYQRRVGFAQSILSNPPLLLLDEPTDGLDPNQKKHIRGLISQMGKDKTILISTHLLEEAENVCNRIIMINKGIIVADGSLKDILAQHNKKNLEEIFYDLAGEEGEKA
jgi:ABC-2 type transport system ATP-binding protein